MSKGWIWTVLAGLISATALAGELTEIEPPGPHCKKQPAVHRQAETYKFGEPVVGTSYFYWYDVETGEHVKNTDGSDALTTHPPEKWMDMFSYNSVEWHYVQLQDVRQAKIDFILPVYWGIPGTYDQFSNKGLPPLVEAHDRMAKEHEQDASNPAPPKIGMFYDTTTLIDNRMRDYLFSRGEHIDLTTERGREWFYVTIRDFFSMIPPRKWARVDGRPIVFLYAGEFAKDIDEKLFADTRRRFKNDFGTGLFIVRHADWPGEADAWYRWGGSSGLLIGDHVAALGPGYDHSAVPGREARIFGREGGDFYKRQWEKLLVLQPEHRPWMVHVETWNEWHEATDIARSEEYGDQYIKLTAKYAQLFKEDRKLDVSGPFDDVKKVSWAPANVEGLNLVPPHGDGHWKWRDVAGRPAVATMGAGHEDWGRFFYFDIHNSYAYDVENCSAKLSITFLNDGGCNALLVEYDSTEAEKSAQNGAFRDGGSATIKNNGLWRNVTLTLPEVRFCNRTNQGDFRIKAIGGKKELTIRKVELKLQKNSCSK
jgi:hypothetical protein